MSGTDFVCDLTAITAEERPRYEALLEKVRGAIRDQVERVNGYTFQLAAEAVTLPEIAEWISMERTCCPFLTLQLSVTGEQANWLLTITGPEGAKPLLAGLAAR